MHKRAILFKTASIVLLFMLCLAFSFLLLPSCGRELAVAQEEPGSGWVDVSPTGIAGEITGVSALDGDTAWIAVYDSILHSVEFLKTTNGGADWLSCGTFKASGEPDICAVDAATVWATAANTVLKSSDGGTTWDKVLETPYYTKAYTFYMDIQALDGARAWVGREDYAWLGGAAPQIVRSVMMTSDGGATWTQITVPHHAPSGYALNITDVEPIDDSAVWASGEEVIVASSYSPTNNGFVSRSLDGGTTWGTTFFGNMQVFDICPLDAATAWATVYDFSNFYDPKQGVILKTSDGGASWDVQYTDPQRYLYEICAVDACTVWTVGESPYYGSTGRSRVILRTTDGGTAWTAQYESPEGYLSDVSAVDAATAWAGGKSPSGGPLVLRTEDGGDLRPDVVSISPPYGSRGSEILISGCDFGGTQGSSRVFFGDVEAAEYVSWSQGEIVVRVPESIAQGETAVTVTTPEGTSNPMGFEVMGEISLTSITPDHGTQYTLFLDIESLAGDDFMPGAEVRLEKDETVLNAYNVNVVSETEITASISLLGAPPGTYDVVVENPNGQEARLPSAFTVDPFCGTGSGTALLMLGLTLGLLSLAGTARKRRRGR